MRKVFRWIGIGLAGVVALVLLLAGFSAWKSGRILSRQYTEIVGKDIAMPNDSASVARGRHITETFGGCSSCHARDLGGQAIDAMPFAAMNIPNITYGIGGLPQDYSIADLDLAIRHGVKRDRSGMMMMPAYHMNRMADEDVAAIYAYLKIAPRVERNVAPYELGPIGCVVLAMGGISVQPEYTDHSVQPRRPEIAPTAEYGRYVAELGCMGCHGPNYSGGPVFEGEPSWPPATNLTKVFKQYNANAFVNLMRTGKRPDGTVIDARPMPTDIFREFDDTELAALWAYLSVLPPTEDGSQTWAQVLKK